MLELSMITMNTTSKQLSLNQERPSADLVILGNDGDVALTLDKGIIEVWRSHTKSLKTKVFEYGSKKRILFSDCGYEFKDAKEAPGCYYKQLWFGEFPYSSWSWSVRLCKTTGIVKISCIDTEINGRGVNPSDEWVARCKSYVAE